MNREELRSLVGSLSTIESIALLSSVSSTNDLARQVIAEWVENEIVPPPAMIIAREQRSGRGRGSNNWLSPADAGIYATTILRREKEAIALLPLEIANLVAEFITETFEVESSIKWPNDVLLGGRKVAGILIEARLSDGMALLAIGTGINVLKAGPMYPSGISIEEASGKAPQLDEAVVAFVRKVDTMLSTRRTTEQTLRAWRKRTVHRPGERVNVMIGTQRTDAEWIDIDDFGRASVLTSSGVVQIAAGDLVRIEQ